MHFLGQAKRLKAQEEEAAMEVRQQQAKADLEKKKQADANIVKGRIEVFL